MRLSKYENKKKLDVVFHHRRMGRDFPEKISGSKFLLVRCDRGLTTIVAPQFVSKNKDI